MNFYNTSNSFEKFDAVCLLKDASQQWRMQVHIKNVNSVFHITLLNVFFKWFKILKKTTSEIIDIVFHMLSFVMTKERNNQLSMLSICIGPRRCYEDSKIKREERKIKVKA